MTSSPPPVPDSAAQAVETLREALVCADSFALDADWPGGGEVRRRVAEAEEALAAVVAELETAREVVEAAHKWDKARERTNACHDEFGWGQEGYGACAEYQDVEDTAAEALVAALSAASAPRPEATK